MTARPSASELNATSSNPTGQEDISMPTFDTPEPISATIDLVDRRRPDQRERRGATTVDVLPSDASNDEDARPPS